MSDWTIRDARPVDLPQITEIFAEEVRHGTASWSVEPPDLAEMTRRFDALTAQGYPYLVADRDGRVLGYCSAGPYRPRPGYRFTVENSIYARAEARGTGVAQALMNELIRRCEAGGFRQMIAVIGDSVDNPSIRFHEKMGFRHAGTFENIGWKFGRWLDSVVMQKTLGPGAETPPEERP